MRTPLITPQTPNCYKGHPEASSAQTDLIAQFHRSKEMYDGKRKDAISKNKMEAEQKRLAAEEKRTRMREHRAQEKGKLI